MRKKQYIRCKDSRSYRTYDERVFIIKSNTQTIIDNMVNSRPSKSITVVREDGTITVKKNKNEV